MYVLYISRVQKQMLNLRRYFETWPFLSTGQQTEYIFLNIFLPMIFTHTKCVRALATNWCDPQDFRREQGFYNVIKIEIIIKFVPNSRGSIEKIIEMGNPRYFWWFDIRMSGILVISRVTFSRSVWDDRKSSCYRFVKRRTHFLKLRFIDTHIFRE